MLFRTVSVEQDRLLGDHGHGAAEALQRKGPMFLAVDQDRPV